MTSADQPGVYLTHEDMSRDVLEQAIRAMEWAKRRGDGLVLAAEEVAALLAERDRLREAVDWVARNGGFAHPSNTVAIARAALKGDQT